MSGPINIECFSCSGGMAEGFRRAGIRFDWVFDKDPDACASYAANLKHKPIQVDVRDLLTLVRGGWRPGPVRLMVADPPCTPWSRAGKRRGVEDERDMLHQTTELILLLQPECYLIGNVPGLNDSTQWHHIQRALAPLRKAGYCIADYAELDAADYGVPQHRVRPFWFGHLKGPCIRWPMPTHGNPRNNALPGLELKPWVTCRQALQHLSLEELGRPCKLIYRGAKATTEAQRKRAGKKARASRIGEPAEVVRATADVRLSLHPDHNLSRPDAPAKTITRNTHGDGCVIVNDRHPPAHPAHPAQTLGAKDRGQSTVLVADSDWPWARPATTTMADPRIGPPGHHESSWLSPKEWPWDCPSTVVFAGTAQTGGPGKGSPGSRPSAVVLSERAATILQGFPECWVFAGATKKARWSQLGQAMPPALAQAVAEGVRWQMEQVAEEAA